MLKSLAILLTLSLFAGPSGKDSQLEQSKKLYQEGVEAMDKGEAQAALAAFQQGYALAPELHVFNYNIAAAAEATGDCRLALKAYQRFLDLVPEHPERGNVEGKLADLRNSCDDEQPPAVVQAPASDVEIAPTGSAAERRKERERALAHAALNEAAFQLNVAAQMYANDKSRFTDTRAFNRPARRKKWNVKRMQKLMASLGVKAEKRDMPEAESVSDAKGACRSAKIQESRTLRALETALEKFESNEAFRVLGRFARWSEQDLERFKECGQ